MSYINIFTFNIKSITLYKCNYTLIIIIDYNNDLLLLKHLN
jgi:hypothetical protein